MRVFKRRWLTRWDVLGMCRDDEKRKPFSPKNLKRRRRSIGEALRVIEIAEPMPGHGPVTGLP